MHRTIGDSYGLDGSKRIYRQEIPGVSDATQVTYDAMNALQEEIANVIEAEGITLNSSAEAISAMTQLNQAIDAKVSAEAALRSAEDILLKSYLEHLATGLWNAINGLQMSNNGADPARAIDIGYGGAFSYNTEPLYNLWSVMLALPNGARKKQIDAVWNPYPATGGRASGVALEAGWYHVFIIGKAISGGFAATDIDFGFDTDINAVNLKADTGWGTAFMYRRIGSVYYTGATIYPFIQRGDLFLWNPPVFDSSELIGGATQSYTLQVPIGVSVKALVQIVTTAAATHRVEFVDGPLGSEALVTGGPYLAGSSGTAGVGGAEIVTDTSGRFFWLATIGSPVTAAVYCRGYQDFRGKDLVA